MHVNNLLAVVVFSSALLNAEDFSLSANGIGPMTVHSELKYESSGVRLAATVKNDSGQSLSYADLCVKASGRDSCLYEMRNKETVRPGEILTFNVIFADHVPSLAHQVTIVGLNLSSVQAAPATPPAAQTVPPTPSASAQRASAVLTNDTILKLVKAGLGDDVIVGMVNSQQGQYAVDSEAVIAMKQAGVSDKIISAVVAKASSPAAPTTPAPALSTFVPTVPSVSSSGPFVLHDGTPVRLRLARNLSSADAKTGETIDFEVLDDLQVDDVILVKRGAVANGTVTDAEAKKRMARGGKLDVTIDYVRLVNGEKVALRGSKDTKGGGHTGAMTGAIVATALVVWPAAPFFLFMHGKDTVIPKGTEITGYVNGEITLDRSKFTSQARPQ